MEIEELPEGGAVPSLDPPHEGEVPLPVLGAPGRDDGGQWPRVAGQVGCVWVGRLTEGDGRFFL